MINPEPISITQQEKEALNRLVNDMDAVGGYRDGKVVMLVENTQDNKNKLNKFGIDDATIDSVTEDGSLCLLDLMSKAGLPCIMDDNGIKIIDDALDVDFDGIHVVFLRDNDEITFGISNDTGARTFVMDDELREKMRSILA